MYRRLRFFWVYELGSFLSFLAEDVFGAFLVIVIYFTTSKSEEDGLRSSYLRNSAVDAGSEVFDVKYGIGQSKIFISLT